jgi:drug/metabolite transporter (DMT)-like permease
MRAPRGAILALASALLFGASTPLAKALLDETDPWLLAGLLYLGAGLGLGLLHGVGRVARGVGPGEAALRGSEWAWLLAAVAAGGVLGPILLMSGLSRTPAAGASLLLTLEGVMTALLAWFAFGEHVDRRIALGMAAITAGAVALSWQGGSSLGGLLGPLAIAGACLAWAVDNNLSRAISLADPIRIATLKGCVAGAVNTLIALGLGASWPRPGVLAGAAIVGFAGYGVSLVLFVHALRALGTARTAAYFALAPFVGASVAVIALGERVTAQLIVAAACMAAGAWLHLSERHGHAHRHGATAHEHRHIHDAHHQHVHAGHEPPGAPHSHRHDHALLVHRHPHFPDAHHRHGHRSLPSDDATCPDAGATSA